MAYQPKLTRIQAASTLDSLRAAIITKTVHEIPWERIDEAINLANTLLLGTELPDTDLVQLFAKQSELMNMLGVPTRLNYPARDPILKDTMIMLLSEAVEVLNPLTTASKPWKQIPEADLLEEVRHEITDVLFFLMEAAMQAGLTPEILVQRYESKRQEVLERIRSRAE